jgi:alcohol dehydrogenase class IV
VSHAAGPRSTASNGEVEALLLPAVMRYDAPVTAARPEVVAQVMAPSATGAGTGACAGLGDRAAATIESFLRRLVTPPAGSEGTAMTCPLPGVRDGLT